MTPQNTHKLGFGTWQFGGPNYVGGKPTGWGDFDTREATRAVHYALDHGITFFDTADTYGRGQAERFLGQALRSYAGSAKAVICTKFGNREVQPDVFVKDYSPQYLYQCVAASLDRLACQQLDTLLIHSPDDVFDWTNHDPQPYQRLLQQGVIGAYGVSSRSVYGAKKVVEAGFGTVIELTYNAIDRRAESELFDQTAFDKYQFVARVPLASGFLNPKYLLQDPVFQDNEYRRFMAHTDQSWLLAQVRRLGFLDDLEGGMAVSALRFALTHPRVGRVIPGMRTVAQVAQNLLATQLGPLPDDVLKKIIETVPDVPDHWKPKVQ